MQQPGGGTRETCRTNALPDDGALDVRPRRLARMEARLPTRQDTGIDELPTPLEALRETVKLPPRRADIRPPVCPAAGLPAGSAALRAGC